MRIRLFPLLALLLALSCHRPAKISTVEPSLLELNKSSVQQDSLTHAILWPYKSSLDSQMNVIIGKTTEAMTKEKDKSESTLGNFVADVCLLSAPDADLCLLNNGGLRSSLPKGDITLGNIYELMPFDNELVVLTLSGPATYRLCRYIAASGGQPCAGIKMGIKTDKTPGSLLIKGVPFDSTRTYRVVTSDYLAQGGDKMDFFRNPIETKNTGVKIRDAIILHFRQLQSEQKSVTPKVDGRVYYEVQ